MRGYPMIARATRHAELGYREEPSGWRMVDMSTDGTAHLVANYRGRV